MSKKLVFKTTLLASLLCFSALAVGQGVGAVDPENAAWGNAKKFHHAKLAPSGSVTPLPKREPRANERSTVERADRIFENNPALAMLLIDRGQIIYERYRAPADQTSPLFSWSMSKSLTALTIGTMVCDGKIPDINQPAGKYSRELQGTIFGEASVKSLLTMSSGIATSQFVGNQKPGATKDDNEWMDMRAQRLSVTEFLKWDTHKQATRLFGGTVLPGTRFNYSSSDTLSLSNIADNNGGFVSAFTKGIWNQVGAENTGYWMLDKDNRAVAQSGFGASGRDWARMAMFSLRTLKDKDTCMGKFMADATRDHLSNSDRRVGKAFKGYGYQTWIADFGPNNSYWWVGFGGQRIGVDPVNERIIVLSSHQESYMDEIYRMFDQWQRQ